MNKGKASIYRITLRPKATSGNCLLHSLAGRRVLAPLCGEGQAIASLPQEDIQSGEGLLTPVWKISGGWG